MGFRVDRPVGVAAILPRVGTRGQIGAAVRGPSRRAVGLVVPRRSVGVAEATTGVRVGVVVVRGGGGVDVAAAVVTVPVVEGRGVGSVVAATVVGVAVAGAIGLCLCGAQAPADSEDKNAQKRSL